MTAAPRGPAPRTISQPTWKEQRGERKEEKWVREREVERGRGRGRGEREGERGRGREGGGEREGERGRGREGGGEREGERGRGREGGEREGGEYSLSVLSAQFLQNVRLSMGTVPSPSPMMMVGFVNVMSVYISCIAVLTLYPKR